MSKHKKKQSPYGSAPRGPARWERAAANAFMHPNSSAAKLYLDRVTNAHRLRTEYPNTKGPFLHPKERWNYPTRSRTYVRDEARYYTCSLYCAAMVCQLDFGLGTYDGLLDFMMDHDGRPGRSDPVRTVRCQCCGTSIAP